MSRTTTISAVLGLALSFSALAQDMSFTGFKDRFTLHRDEQGKVDVVRLNRVTKFFSIKPFIQQIKNDLLGEQNSLEKMGEANKIAELDRILADMGFDQKTEEGQEEAQNFKDSILNIKNIDVEASFAELDQQDFWHEFESRLNEAFLFLDPTVLANLNDPRFFYKKNVTHQVVVWALEQAKKRFANVPILNIASFVIVRIHDMMLEQRLFHHNMMLHYFEKLEPQLGMTKEEVDLTVSSIYEYKIQATDLMGSNRAAETWATYGMNQFFALVRAGNATARGWSSPLSAFSFTDVKKLNYAFAEVMNNGSRQIYHLHHKAHMFSSKPALAYDYANPKKVKRMRSLLNIAGVALGFLKLPDFVKNAAETFMNSMYVEQVRTEGALIGYFETTGNTQMAKSIYGQRTNLYIQE